jgi:hypothetical protein
VAVRLPDRTPRSVGHSGYGTPPVARPCHHPRARLELVSRPPGANRFDPPPPDAGNGRPRVEGGRPPKPRRVATAAPVLIEMAVSGEGGGRGA